MTRRREERRYQHTQERLRWEWRSQAFGVLSAHTRQLKPRWGMGGGVDRVIVRDQDWLELPNPTGCGWVALELDPTIRLDMAAFRAHWDLVMGYPDRPAWRWEFNPAPPGWLVGHPYELPTSAPLPAVPYHDPDWADRVVLGQAEDGSTLVHDLDEAPHGMIAGKTQRGKTYLLLLYAIHLLAAGRLQALVVLDPKGGQYPMLEVAPGHPAAWNPDTCTGIHVAQPNLGPDGRLVDYADLEAAAEAVDRETGRRRIHSQNSESLVPPSFYRQARVVCVFDEAGDMLWREANPAAKDHSRQADLTRDRNRQRETLERVLCHVAMMGGGFGTTVLPAAQSPRRVEGIPGVVHENTAHKVYLGKGDADAMRIIFGRGFGLPASPLDLPGRGVWQNNRIGAPVTDPYLAFQAFLPDLDRLARLVDTFTPATLPVTQGSSSNGQVRTAH